VALYFRQTLRTSAESMSLLTGLKEVVETSRVPVYSMVDAHVGHGVVGGMVSDIPHNTRQLAMIAMRLANGTPVGDVPPVLAATLPMFDWRQLEKWGIPESRLPEGSIVLFRPQTIWSQYSYHVAAAIGVVSAQFVTIGLLLFLKQRRARAEAALRASEARNTAILKTVPDLMFILSSDGVFLDYHAKDPAELFVPPEQFLGRNSRDIFPPDFAEMFERRLQEAVRSGQIVVFEYALPMHEARRQYECRMVRYSTDNVMAIVRDVTLRHQSEAQLHLAQTDLANATRVRVLAEMAAGIAHEVNQPITAIVMNAQTGLRQIAEQPHAGILQEVLHDIVSDGKRAAEVIGRVRDMVTQAPPRMSALDINDVVRDVIALSARTLQARDVRLQLDLARLPPTIGDPVQLQQVLLNLIVNGIDAMQENPPSARLLSIRSVKSSGGVAVRVSDSGQGLTEEVLQRLFMPFFSTKINGMGIGLSISRSIAELHGGHLRIVQNSGQGATFELELPVAAE
jgi:PAS domain S-box-containing protein